MLRIDPAARPLWRTPDSVQFGTDPVVAVLDPVPPGADRVLGALVDGVDDAGLRTAAQRARVTGGALHHLLRAVAPALLPETAPVPAALAVAIDAPADLAALLGGLLDLPVGTAADDADLVLVAAHHLVPPAATVRHLQRDVPHLAVVFGDQAVTIGPFVRPGATPCLRCAEEHRLDAPERRAVAAQLLRRSDSLTARSVTMRLQAAVLVAETVTAMRSGRRGDLDGVELRLAPDGSVSRRPRPWHERCSCRWPAPPA